jgi:hypothetical protein
MVSSSTGIKAAPSVSGGGLSVDVNLERRVEILEETMEQLRDVPARLSAVESQIPQLRNEMQGGFTELREEMRAGYEALRTEMRELNAETRAHMLVLHEEVISRLALLQEGISSSSPKGDRRRRKTR